MPITTTTRTTTAAAAANNNHIYNINVFLNIFFMRNFSLSKVLISNSWFKFLKTGRLYLVLSLLYSVSISFVILSTWNTLLRFKSMLY